MEKPERAVWQKRDDVVAALGLKADETLVDVGAGSGYVTFRFAKALPNGKVIAADTEAEMKSEARLALIEFKEGTLPEGPSASAKIPRAPLMSQASKAGLSLEGEKVNVLPYQVYLVFRKP
jgi:SAM-dependent methyltransferase